MPTQHSRWCRWVPEWYRFWSSIRTRCLLIFERKTKTLVPRRTLHNAPCPNVHGVVSYQGASKTPIWRNTWLLKLGWRSLADVSPPSIHLSLGILRSKSLERLLRDGGQRETERCVTPQTYKDSAFLPTDPSWSWLEPKAHMSFQEGGNVSLRTKAEGRLIVGHLSSPKAFTSLHHYSSSRPDWLERMLKWMENFQARG